MAYVGGSFYEGIGGGVTGYIGENRAGVTVEFGFGIGGSVKGGVVSEPMEEAGIGSSGWSLQGKASGSAFGAKGAVGVTITEDADVSAFGEAKLGQRVTVGGEVDLNAGETKAKVQGTGVSFGSETKIVGRYTYEVPLQPGFAIAPLAPQVCSGADCSLPPEPTRYAGAPTGRVGFEYSPEAQPSVREPELDWDAPPPGAPTPEPEGLTRGLDVDTAGAGTYAGSPTGTTGFEGSPEIGGDRTDTTAASEGLQRGLDVDAGGGAYAGSPTGTTGFEGSPEIGGDRVDTTASDSSGSGGGSNSGADYGSSSSDNSSSGDVSASGDVSSSGDVSASPAGPSGGDSGYSASSASDTSSAGGTAGPSDTAQSGGSYGGAETGTTGFEGSPEANPGSSPESGGSYDSSVGTDASPGGYGSV